ncbi:methyltransferase [Archaeoglobus neptunius]|uniref:methyltransferase n=1 Tax=Archaeoglobus neptunius TaxID=2798580 RepID=UPI001926A7DC|nr:methyltransferase [Archaeoglobus neptunius]
MFEIPEHAEYFEKTINEWSDGFRKIQLLRAAIELGIFDMLSSPKTAEEVASKIGHEKLVKLVLDCLANLGLVESKDGMYELSETFKPFLTSDSPYSQLRFLGKQFSDLEQWTKLAEIIRDGPVRVERSKFFSDLVIHSMAENALLGELQRTVRIVAEYEEFRRARRLLDLGGGHGLYSIAFTKLNARLTAVVFDLPEVVERAREYVRKYGGERVKFIAGDFFVDDIGEGYDIVFSSYNPSGKNVWMIDKIRDAMNSGGLYVNKQYFKNRNEKIDLMDLEWNLWTFGEIEKAEKKYTFSKDLHLEMYLRELSRRGFDVLDVHEFGEASMIIARKK